MSSFNQLWARMDAQEKQALAEKCGTSKQYLSQIAYGHRNGSKDMLQSLIAADSRIHSGMFL